ncbi:hypothetical protein BDN71DRAFT_1477460 [Pleurotus eryngii]|uniref:Uncharacterized protein n=1 Tax=Pleurotus eryngii TaxID=5323 RepID=A0A9P5ZLY8_PLEER|nr:hypothetical protein BDN71DRAFT_1477460 [Pleurotus eryngii]
MERDCHRISAALLRLRSLLFVLRPKQQRDKDDSYTLNDKLDAPSTVQVLLATCPRTLSFHQRRFAWIHLSTALLGLCLLDQMPAPGPGVEGNHAKLRGKNCQHTSRALHSPSSFKGRP